MSKKSVKIVAPTSDAARAQANIKESLRLHNVQFPEKPANPPKGKVVKINSNPVRTTSGISGKGGSMVGSVYRPMGSGGATNQYNK